MAKKIAEYQKEIEKALKASGSYSRGLDSQVVSLAGALRTLALANDEIDNLESTTVSVTSRYGNSTVAAHPVFKIQKDAQESVTRQMKALGLTTADLAGSDDNDPLIELTKKVKSSSRRKPKIIKPEPTGDAS